MYNGKKVVAMLNCHGDDVVCFRKEIIDELEKQGYLVVLSCPESDRLDVFRGKESVIVEPVTIDRRGTNPIKDIGLFRSYCKLYKKYKPDVVLAFTIKPNIYGSIAARRYKIPYVNNITGLGSGFDSSWLIRQVIIHLYRFALKKSECVYFQNEENAKIVKKCKIVRNQECQVIPGSGVNLKKFEYKEYKQRNKMVFNYIGRVMKEKSIDDYLACAKKIHQCCENVEFNIIGFIEDTEQEYVAILQQLENEGVISYKGSQNDVRPFIEECDAIIHPSFYGEGMSNVLLETAAVGRALITTDIAGCREVVSEGENGYLYAPQNIEELVECVKRFIELPYEQRKKMSKKSREIVEKNFSREIVVKKYQDIVARCVNK